jgi:hypothetical protein
VSLPRHYREHVLSAIITDPDYLFMRYAPGAHVKKEGHQVFHEVPELALAKGAKAEFRTGSNPCTNAVAQ